MLVPQVRAQGAAQTTSGVMTGHGDVLVMYAGSLTDMMENDLGPKFARATGFAFRGEGKGSNALGSEIKGKLRRADVFISASSSVDDTLTGKANGDWVRWYVTFAEAPVVVGYNPKSRFASSFTDATWLSALSQSGLRLGRTDPKLDPKGARAIELLQNAQSYYHIDGLVQKILGGPENPRQIFPEQGLVGRLQSGQLDAGFFYSNEATEQGIPYVTPPAAIDPKAAYTLTILEGAPHQTAAEAFIQYLFSPAGQAILKHHGLTILEPTLTGAASAVPAVLRPIFTKP